MNDLKEKEKEENINHRYKKYKKKNSLDYDSFIENINIKDIDDHNSITHLNEQVYNIKMNINYFMMIINLMNYTIKAKSFICIKNNNGEKSLFKACLFGNENMVKYLLIHGVYINNENYIVKHLYLFFVNVKMKFGYENIIKILDEYGTDINKEKGFLNIVKVLVEYGVYKYKNEYEFKLLEGGYINIEKVLDEQGVNINKEDKYEETPLFISSHVRKDMKIFGAEINKENK
ncbi:hypothetical protein H8356DRAFT_1339187 [Neocallimastix lanati (nom. inval.)]|nr:hypothetical protein H8356DRAFT_1339187 [Neocallimastix sp. JGI-2020a]